MTPAPQPAAGASKVPRRPRPVPVPVLLFPVLATAFGICHAATARSHTVFPAETTFRGQTLEFRSEYQYTYRFFFDLYRVALYTAPGATARDLLQRRRPFRLKFHYLREIEKRIILRSADKMLEKNLTPSSRRKIADRVARLNEAYRTVREGDTSALTYLPGEGTFLTVNGEQKARIEGADFAHLYFRIWLGHNPISGDLKATLLDPL